MTNILSMSPVACWAIELYQRWISPRKGFCCAYRVRHVRRDSCSQYGKRAITKLGILAGLHLLRRRFDRCNAAAKRVLDYEPRRKHQKGAKATDTSRRSCDLDPGSCHPGDACDLVSDCGDLSTSVDAGSCDAGGCDVGGCDLSI